MTPKQKKFIAEYLKGRNATQAAIKAGYSKKTAYSIGQENLKKPEIAAEIKAAYDRIAAKAEITAERIIAELAKVAFANVGHYATWGGDTVSLKNSTELTEEQKAAVSEIGQTVTKDGGSFRFKLHDKIRALEKLGQHLGLFDEKDPEDDNKQPPTETYYEHEPTRLNGVTPH